MRLYHCGKQGNFRSMSLVHAMARKGMEGLVLVEPDHRFVCLGYFDDAEATVDFDFCVKNDLAVMRRETGGGVVLLGPGQLFYQLILKRENPEIPFRIEDAYRKFSAAPIMAYKRLGIEVSYEPVSDLVTNHRRKIAGQGAADIGPCFVYVGNILLDFDPELMSRCLKLPDEEFRRQVCRSMEKNLSWVGKELGGLPEREELYRLVAEEFARVLGPMEESETPADLWQEADELGRYLTSEECIFMESSRRHSKIKVREGTYLRHGCHKAAAGMIRANVEIEQGKIERLAISGDLALFPKSHCLQLSAFLRGVEFDFTNVVQGVADFLSEQLIDCPGVDPEDFAWAIVGEQIPE